MKLTCYVVDDEPHNVRTVIQYVEKTPGLELLGYAYNPTIALEEIKAKKPQVVFTDINMPDISGIELASLIDDFTRVVFISAERKAALRISDWKNYFFLNKPLSYKSFSEAVKCIHNEMNASD